MPAFLLPLLSRPWFLKAIAIAGAALALLVAVGRIFYAGKKAQRSEDDAASAKVVQKQRDIAAAPISPAAARQRLRDGDL